MGAPGENLRIDGARLWQSLMEMATIGPGIAGGNNRQAMTPEDAEGRALFRRWREAQGMTLGVDALGTIHARREGADPQAAPVFAGSHLDTQPTWGGIRRPARRARDGAQPRRSGHPHPAADRDREFHQ